jgi:outer membrane protein TolC
MWWIAVAQAATLSEAWDAARGTNPDRAAAEAADARVGQARAAFLPKVQVAAEADATDEAVQLDRMASLPEPLAALTGEMPPIEVQPQRWWQASATVLVPLVDAQGWARAAAAGRAADAADAQARVADARVRAGVAQAFYGLYVAREGVRIAEGAVEVAKRQQEVGRKLVDAGASTERTWLEATQAELAAERDLQGAIAAEIGAGEAFHRLTGLPRETPVELGFAADLPEGLDETRALALSRRPELAAADAQIAAATASRTSAELGWLPTVSARGTALRSGNQGLADDPWFVVGAVQATWTAACGARRRASPPRTATRPRRSRSRSGGPSRRRWRSRGRSGIARGRRGPRPSRRSRPPTPRSLRPARRSSKARPRSSRSIARRSASGRRGSRSCASAPRKSWPRRGWWSRSAGERGWRGSGGVGCLPP